MRIGYLTIKTLMRSPQVWRNGSNRTHLSRTTMMRNATYEYAAKCTCDCGNTITVQLDDLFDHKIDRCYQCQQHPDVAPDLMKKLQSVYKKQEHKAQTTGNLQFKVDFPTFNEFADYAINDLGFTCRVRDDHYIYIGRKKRNVPFVKSNLEIRTSVIGVKE